jgi:hypothetical protein
METLVTKNKCKKCFAWLHRNNIMTGLEKIGFEREKVEKFFR